MGPEKLLGLEEAENIGSCILFNIQRITEANWGSVIQPQVPLPLRASTDWYRQDGRSLSQMTGKLMFYQSA